MLPEDIFAGLTNLDSLSLWGNSLTSLDKGIFDGLINLKRLYLRDNNLTALDKDIFDGLIKLERLYLQDNNLTALDKDIFAPLDDSLTDLYLHRNSLTSLHADTFDGLTGLEWLFLNGNRLAELDENIFEGLTDLQRLYLQDNNLTTLETELFAPLDESLLYLPLSNNGLTTLPEDIFEGLIGLQNLHLSGNRLAELDEDIFEELSALQILHLNGNGLTALATDLFDPLDDSLSQLVLTDNSLTALPDDIFDGLTALKGLDLSCNDLTALDLDRFDPFAASLTFLDITGNDFTTQPTRVAVQAKLSAVQQLYISGDNGECLLPNDTGLSALSLSVGDLFPEFEVPGSNIYTVRVANYVSSMTVYVTPRDSNAVIQPLDNRYSYDDDPTEEGLQINLSTARSNVGWTVQARNGVDSSSYQILVYRAHPDATLRSLSLSDITTLQAFSPHTHQYSASVPSSVSSTRVTAVPNDPGADVEIQVTGAGSLDADGTMVTLGEGANLIRARVTAPDGTEQDYGVIVHRAPAPPPGSASDATLRSLSLSGITLNEPFDPGTTTYSASVVNSVSSTTVYAPANDGKATRVVKLNGAPDNDGTVALAVGPTTITVEVTAQDETTTETYTVTVTRDMAGGPPSTDATLSALTVTGGGSDLVTFVSGDTSYTAMVANDVAEVTVTPTTNDTGATIEYLDGDDATITDAGTADGHQVAVVEGDNVIKVKVTAADGNTTETYTVMVNRAAANNAPAFPSATLTRTLPENTAANQNVGATIPAATDADAGDTLTYSMEGADAASFTFEASTRQIRTTSGVTYDYEAKPSYSVTVTASDGTASGTIDVTITVTDEDEPPAAPAAPTLTATAGSTTSLDVSWTAPGNTGKPPITSYDLRYRVGDSGSWTDGPQDETGTTAAISALAAGTEYQVQVRASNAEGDSGWSAAGTGSTSAPGNNAPVFSDATLTRTVPENTAANQDVGAVIPEATDLDDDSLTYTMEGTDAASFTFDTSALQIQTSAALDFEAKNSYSVTVKADDGTASATIDVTINVTDVDEQPDTPAKPTLAVVSTTSLTATWVKPGLNGGPDITGYNVNYRVNTVTAWGTFTHSGTGVTRTITGLTASTLYQVRVQALNGETPSAWSEPSDAVSTNTETTLSSDATLSSLELSGIPTLNPAFSSSHISYTASVTNTVSSTTVTATTTDPAATTEYLDGSDMTLTDADTSVTGQQVTLAEGDNVIKVKVTAADTTTTLTYAVTVNRPAAATTPTIVSVEVTSTPMLTSSGGSTPDTYGEGEDIEFTVTFSEAVKVTGDPQFGFSLAEARLADYDSGSGSERLTFVYTVQPTDQDDDGIQVGNHASGNPTLQLDADDTITSLGGTDANLEHATLDVLPDHKVDGSRTVDEPVEPLEVTLHLSDADGEVDEDAGAVTVTATVSPASATAFTVTISASPVAPATDDDFELSTNRELSFAANATASTGTVTIAPVDDAVVEPNQQVVTVSGSASIEGVTGPDDVTLTILDDDQVGGICDRTERVRDRILTLLKYRHSYKGGCGDVNETHLAKLKSLDLGRNPSTESAFTLSLRSDDFKGLVNLERLDLRDTGLRSLPAGVFSGLAKLDTLGLGKNQLRLLPAGVFSDLKALTSLDLSRNPSLHSPPFDEFEALPNLTKLWLDSVGRHKLQVAGGEGDAALVVAAGGSVTYKVRLLAAPDFRVTAANPLMIEVSSDTAGVVATPAKLPFTRENWFRSQTVTVSALSSASGTAELAHEGSGTTTDSEGREQSNYDFEDYPLPKVTVQVLESQSSRSSR